MNEAINKYWKDCNTPACCKGLCKVADAGGMLACSACGWDDMQTEPRGNPIPEWKKLFISLNHETMTAHELCDLLKISDCKVYAYCREHHITTKPSKWYKGNRQPGEVVRATNRGPYVRYAKEEKSKTQRPPAVYSNTNYSNL